MASCAIPLLLAGVLSGAGWAIAGQWMPGIALSVVALAALARWQTTRRRAHPADCACGENCSCPAGSREHKASNRTRSIELVEALTNVRKHAGTDRCVVPVTADATAVSVSILDRGRGFDPHEVTHRFGIGQSILTLGVVGWRIRLGHQRARPRYPGHAGSTAYRRHTGGRALTWPAGGAVRIAVVHDHPIARVGVERAFTGHPQLSVVVSVGSLAELDPADEHVDLVLLDLYLETGRTPPP